MITANSIRFLMTYPLYPYDISCLEESEVIKDIVWWMYGIVTDNVFDPLTVSRFLVII